MQGNTKSIRDQWDFYIDIVFSNIFKGYSMRSVVGVLIISIYVCEEAGCSTLSTESTSTQALIAATGALTLISASVSNSSPNSLWQSVDLVQSLQFLILSRIFLPQKLVKFITSNTFMMLNFGLPGIESAPLIKDLLSLFEFEQPVKVMQTLQIDSASTFRNIFVNLLLLGILILLHLCIFLLLKWSSKWTMNC